MALKWPSKNVRDAFIQYFIRHPKYPHKHVPSSSIVPRNDPSLAFVNAGMNQFKDIILGVGRPPNPTVVNSQKCLRINDLSLVGADTYHHTFFEMLGNWSFASYFKPEACEMAWELLTDVYKLDPARMYVTYYAGGHNIPADTETRDIWKALGVPEERILPFGAENFWTMGPIGPCGPSTEIHYDHRGSTTEISEVNGDSGRVVEVWNLVFMQYNRSADGSFERLPLAHVVDTGAGLERLTAVLNGKVSNYDTDLFLPIFETLLKNSNAPAYQGTFDSESDADSDYRVFADHIRAITVALSDGILPQTNHKVLKLVRRLLYVSQRQFAQSFNEQDLVELLIKSVKTVTDSLSPTYTQIADMNAQINEILRHEVSRFLEAQKRRAPKNSRLPLDILDYFPRLERISQEEISQAMNKKAVDGKTALRWYDSCGVSEDAIEELCAHLNLEFRREEFQNESLRKKFERRLDFAHQIAIDDERQFIKNVESALWKQNPEVGGGLLQPNMLNGTTSSAKIQHIFTNDGELCEDCASIPDKECWVTLTKTPFIPSSQYMDSDVGFIILNNGNEFKVTKVISLPSDWILHQIKGAPTSDLFEIPLIAEFFINNERRFGREISAKVLYSLQRWMIKKFGVVRFSKLYVCQDKLNFEITIMKGGLDQVVIEELEADLNEIGDPVVVIKKTSESNGVYFLECATGVEAEKIKRHSEELKNCLNKLAVLMNETSHFEDVEGEIRALRHLINIALVDTGLTFSLSTINQSRDVVQSADKFLLKKELTSLTKIMTDTLVSDDSAFVIKVFFSDFEFSSLKKITRPAEHKPVLVLITSSNGDIQGRCVVPQALVETGASAEKWMQAFANELGSCVVAPPKGQNPSLVCNLKRTSFQDLPTRLKRGTDQATLYIQSYTSENIVPSSQAS